MIRRSFLLVLLSLAGTIASCLLLGIGLYWRQAAMAAVLLFVVAMLCLLAGTVHYIREVVVALSSVHHEANDARFMDLGAPPEIRADNALNAKYHQPTWLQCRSLFFDIEINLRRGPVLGYLLTIKFHL